MNKIEATAVVVVSIVAFLLFKSKTSEHHTPTLRESYEYIIVGAGTAGSVLASRLSENADVTVLLIEAGGNPDGRWEITIPGAATAALHTEFDWEYYTVKQKHAGKGSNGQKLYLPRGRGLGGTGNLNTLVYNRASRYDYDEWAAQGCEGWSYQEVLPYFLKSEDMQIEEFRDSKYHSKGGPLKVTRTVTSPLTNKFVHAGNEMGYDTIDCNGKNQEGFCFMQSNVKRGERCGPFQCFLKQAMERSNLHVSINSVASKVLMDGKRAVGVELIRNARKQTIKADKEVIVSAGSYDSPKILMLSGIGPKNHLKALGIPVIADLPVGKNLEDHVLVMMAECTNASMSVTAEKANSLSSKFQYYFYGEGFLASAAAVEATAFFHTDTKTKEKSQTDIQMFLAAGSPNKDFMTNFYSKEVAEDYYDCEDEGFHNFLILLHEKSRGMVTLQSRDPFDPPLIDPNYLQHPDDIKTLIKGIRIHQKLMKTKAFGRIVPKTKRLSMCSKHEFDSDQYWKCFIEHVATSGNHPSTTCKMGGKMDQTAVVDPQLRVKTVSGLRVVDASIFPTSFSGTLNAPIIMLAEKAADMILNKKPLPKVDL